MATVIGKSAKKQFPTYVGEFWSMSSACAGDNYLHSMATVIGKSAKKQFPAYVGEFWSMSPTFAGDIYLDLWKHDRWKLQQFY